MSLSKKKMTICWQGLVTGKMMHLPGRVQTRPDKRVENRSQTTEERTVAGSGIAEDLKKLKSIADSFTDEEKKSTNVKRFISRATLILKIAGP